LPPFFGLFAQGSYDLGEKRPTREQKKLDIQGFFQYVFEVDFVPQKFVLKFDLAF